MREDLATRVGLRYPEDWVARLFRYGAALNASTAVAAFIRQEVGLER